MPKSESSSPGSLLAGVFLDHTELAIDVMADIAALAEFGIGLSGHVGHIRLGNVAGRTGGGSRRSGIHQEVRSLYRGEPDREDGFGARDMAHFAVGRVVGPVGEAECGIAYAAEVGGSDLIGGAGSGQVVAEVDAVHHKGKVDAGNGAAGVVRVVA